VQGKGITLTVNTRDTKDRMIVSDTNLWLTPRDIWSGMIKENEPDSRENSIKKASRARVLLLVFLSLTQGHLEPRQTITRNS